MNREKMKQKQNCFEIDKRIVSFQASLLNNNDGWANINLEMNAEVKTSGGMSEMFKFFFENNEVIRIIHNGHEAREQYSFVLNFIEKNIKEILLCMKKLEGQNA